MVNLSGPFGSRQVRFDHKRWRDRFLSVLRDQAPRCRNEMAMNGRGAPGARAMKKFAEVTSTRSFRDHRRGSRALDSRNLAGRIHLKYFLAYIARHVCSTSMITTAFGKRKTVPVITLI